MFVSFRIVDDEWHCRALQFDILGIGTTRNAAFEQLRELVEVYFEDIASELRDGHAVAIYQPADAHEWNENEIEFYTAVCELTDGIEIESESLSMSELGEIAHRIESIELTPLEMN